MEDRNNDKYNLEIGKDFFPEDMIGYGASHEYWKRFWKTGRVEDYLNYTASSREDYVPMDVKRK